MDLKIIFFCTFTISSLMTSFCIESVVTKISYKKPVHPKEKFYSKIKNNVLLDIQAPTDDSLGVLPNEEEDLKTTTSCSEDTCSLSSDDADSIEATSKEHTTPTTITKISTNSTPLDISCICGIFLGSQFMKGSSEPPKGNPVISNTLERSFVCSPVGQKQCLTKCLEQIVQHLPNSANILCASLDHDIHKEKAFLFIRNCSNRWHNTNLAAGREYCCKNSLPYNCPKK